MDARRAAQGASTTLGIVAAGVAARRAWRSGPLTLARMSGTSITAPDAVGWVTDFLNAAYYARMPELRDVEDLRLAFAILTTRWHQHGHHRLHAHDVLAFHRAFFRERILDSAHTPRGTLDREQLFTGAARLIGPWFRRPTSTTSAAPTASCSRRPTRATPTSPSTGCATRSSASSRRPRATARSRSGTPTSRCRSPPRSARWRRSRGPRRGRTTAATSAASPRCAAAAWPARRSRSRSSARCRRRPRRSCAAT